MPEALASIALVLLFVAGLAKISRPDPTRGALRAVDLPSGRSAVRALGLLELISALVGMAFGGWWVSGAAVLYLGFTVFTALATRNRIPVQSCGCFGREETPPSILHVIYNMCAVVGITWFGLTGSGVLGGTSEPFDAAIYLGFVLLGAYLSFLVLTDLPRTLAAATN
jgi:Methylamine utilisation protein MauE